jgi:hypothetical protein
MESQKFREVMPSTSRHPNVHLFPLWPAPSLAVLPAVKLDPVIAVVHCVTIVSHNCESPKYSPAPCREFRANGGPNYGQLLPQVLRVGEATIRRVLVVPWA